MNVDPLAFVPKMYFPKTLYLSGKYDTIIKSYTFKKPFILISKKFQKKSNCGFVNSMDIFNKLGVSGKIYSHDGEPTMADIDRLEKIFGVERCVSII